MAAKPVGWGMIGTRGWSDMILGPAINAARGARFNAVLSSSQEGAERYCASHGVARATPTSSAFLADDAVDVVWIASPNHLHKEQAIAALKAGKHVLCEKPMAMNRAECRAMIRAAGKAGRLLTIGYNSRYHPRLSRFREQWQAGRFGAPVHMHGQFHYRYPHVPDDWWRLDDAKSGCWVLGDVGTHFIDLLRWFNGEAKSVHAHLSNKAYGRSADTAFLTIGFENGAVGTISASDRGHQPAAASSCWAARATAGSRAASSASPAPSPRCARAARRAPRRSRATTPTRRRWRASPARSPAASRSRSAPRTGSPTSASSSRRAAGKARPGRETAAAVDP